MTQLTPFRAPARRSAVRRHEAEAGAGLHAGPRAAGHRARRADDRRRSGVAPRVLEAAVAVPRAGHHDPDVHAVPGRSRALLAHRAAARGQGAGARRAGRAAREPAGHAVRGPRRRRRARRCDSSQGQRGIAQRAGVRRSPARAGSIATDADGRRGRSRPPPPARPASTADERPRRSCRRSKTSSSPSSTHVGQRPQTS